jgi:hypothetical protein
MVLLFPSVKISTPSPPFIPFPSIPFPSLPLYTECKVEKGNFTRNSSSFSTETRVTQTETRVTTNSNTRHNDENTYKMQCDRA